MILWNLIHGCHRKSEGCKHCYVFTRDEEHGIDTNLVRKTRTFRLPLQRNRAREWKIPSGSMVMTCFSSDFFIEEMDAWREEAWQMMRERSDLTFYMVTKRPERITACLPTYWNEIRKRIYICCTMENQKRAEERLPIFLTAPLCHREIIVEPMLEPVCFHGRLEGIDGITVGGESGRQARPCHYEWVLDVRSQCAEAGIGFHFMQTGANFYKDNRNYRLPHALQLQQAHKAAIDLPFQSNG
jgi:protein gp37